jgi:hypothetical protein
MRSMRLRRVILWTVLVAAMIVGVTGGGPAAAEDDCDWWCLEGYWDQTYLACVPSPWQNNCSHCQLTCPGGGGGGFDPENNN